MLNKIYLDWTTVRKEVFLKCSIFKIKYIAETEDKALRMFLESTCEEFVRLGPELFLKQVVEPTILAIFDKTKEDIINRGQPFHNFYSNFNVVKVLNNEKVPLNLSLYMQDVFF